MDNTFLSNGGIVTTDFGGSDSGSSIALQTDGKIIVAGESSGGGDGGFTVVRYNADGSLDITFDGDGKVTTDFGGLEYATSVALQGDGKIVVAGYKGISSSGGGDFALVRYNADGSLDITFDGDGKVTTDFGGWDEAESVTIDSNGKIVVVGYTGISSSGGGDFAVVRYNVDGSLDATFGAGGKVITNVGGEEYAHSVIVQSDNKIVVIGDTGISSSGASDFALVRYNNDGSLDTTFGVSGKVTTNLDFGDFVGGATMQSDGKIVVVGESYSLADMAVSGDQDFVLVRYNTDGSLDTSFADDGTLVADFGGGESATSVAVQADGKIVVTGDSFPAGGSGDSNVIVVRYHTDGTLDTTFSENGFVKTVVGESEGNSVVVQSDGRILVAGQSNGDFSLVRYNSNGSMGLGIDFDGTPIGTPSSYESFADLYFDETQATIAGYIGSALVTLAPPGVVHCFDEDHDGFADHFTRTWVDGNGTQSISGTTVWLDNNIFKSSGSALIGGIPYTVNQYGRAAYDADGDVVGMYFLTVNPVFTLTADTTVGNELVATFTIPNQAETWSLLDSDLNGVVDHVNRWNSWIDQNSVTQIRNFTYLLTWSDITHFTARQVGVITGTSFDALGRPLGITFSNSTPPAHILPITWLDTKGDDNVVATFDIPSTIFGQLLDTNDDNLPDQAVFIETSSSGQKDTATATIQGWSSWSDISTQQVTMEIQTSTAPWNFFTGTINGTSSNPTTVIMPSYFMGNNVVVPETTFPSMTNNSLTFDLGTTGASLASSGSITLWSSATGTITIPVTSLTFDGSHLTIPLSGTDVATNQPYHLYPNSVDNFRVQIPAGVVIGEPTIDKAWFVGEWNNIGYELSPMMIVYNGDGTTDADWVLGTSGNDSVAAGAGDDLMKWSAGNDTIDAGDGYDKLYMPKAVPSANYITKTDSQGVLHIGEVNAATNTIIADAYRITRLAAGSFQIQKMDSTGTTVTQTMLLNNAEVLHIGPPSNYTSVALTINYANEFIYGTPWRDTIYLNASNISTLSQIWAYSSTDTLAIDVGAGYSKIEVVREGSTSLLKGTLIADGTVVDLGSFSKALPSQYNYTATMSIGTGESAHSFTINNIEAYRFTSGDVILTVDPIPPTVISFTPSDNATAIAVGSNIVLTFSETVQAGTGNIVITDGTDVRTIAMTDSSQVSIAGNTLTINPTADLAKGMHYFVMLDAGSIEDLAGNDYAGTTSYDFTTIVGGVITTDFGGDSFGCGVTIQADGKILVVGGGSNGDIALARYNMDGSLDTSFGNETGKLTTDFGYEDAALSTIIQSDGKILVIGESVINGGSYGKCIIARYNIDGSLDTSFDGNGKVITDFLDGLNVDGFYTTEAILQSDGKILIVGGGYQSGNSLVTLFRYNSNGSLDSSFGNNGMVITPSISSLNSSDFPYGVVQQVDEKILVAVRSDNNAAITLIRYNSNGTVDTSFNADSMQITGLKENDMDGGLVLQVDGKILVSGSSNGNIILVRYHSDGTLDSTFNGNGNIVTDLGGNDGVGAITLQPDEKILVSGYSNNELALLRYNTDGTPDTHFCNNGVVLTNIGSDSFHEITFAGWGITVQADGKILVTGQSNGDFALVRYNTDGSLDTSFDGVSEPTPPTHDLSGHITFWKTGNAISNVQATLATMPMQPASDDVAFRNLQHQSNGGYTVELWATTTQTELQSIQLAMQFSDNVTAQWQQSSAVPTGWLSVINNTQAGHLEIGTIGQATMQGDEEIMLGTLTFSAPDNPNNFTLAVTSGWLGDNSIAPTSILCTATDSEGNYSFETIADGWYQITGESNTAKLADAVTAQDALAALRMAVALNPDGGNNLDEVSPFQYLAADINRDGKVRANDALNILKMAVGIESAPADEWIFVAESAASKTMDRSHVDWSFAEQPIDVYGDMELDLVGVVKGDVDGSWGMVG
uniref:SbsA Ig-like domain-containing protein n=1 Tax=Chlorobium chlorochromatii (strain CaD3) TaxID=340177 RepID=Q3ARU1_CHLCH